MEPQVTRTILAVATALLVAPTLFASAAEACISCEYVPEVVRGSQTSDPPANYARERANTVEREQSARPARHVVRSEPVAKSVAKSVDTADEAPVKKRANNENSSISVPAAEVAVTKTAKVDPKAVQSESSSISVASIQDAATETAKVSKPLQSENSSISLASTEVAATQKAPVVETAKQSAAKAADCKKFFPSVGLTLTVPCE